MMKKTNKHKLTAAFTACLLIAGMGASFPATMGAEPPALTVNAEDYTEGTYGVLTYRNYGAYIEITDCNDYAKTVEIPAEIDGLPVTTIGNDAFWGCTSLTSVTIPDSVTEMGWGVFSECTSLESITIPDSVTKIGYSAFYQCTRLTDVYYTGTEEQWNAIAIDGYNVPLSWMPPFILIPPPPNSPRTNWKFPFPA